MINRVTGKRGESGVGPRLVVDMVQESVKKRVKSGGFRCLIRPILALKMRILGLKTDISGTLISIFQYLDLAGPQ
jgi:hypothetical protein